MIKVPSNSDDSSNQHQRRYVFQLNPHDVILGRGPTSFNFEGNFRFMDVVDSRLDDYRSTESTQLKNQVAKEIMDTIHNNSGRFVRQVKAPSELAGLARTQEDAVEDHDSSLSDKKVYKIVSQAEAIDKIKHSLRVARRSSNTKMTASSAIIMAKKKVAPKMSCASKASKRIITTGKNACDDQANSLGQESSEELESLRKLLRSQKEENQQLKAEIQIKDARIQFLESQITESFQWRQEQETDQKTAQDTMNPRQINDAEFLSSSIGVLSRISNSDVSQLSASCCTNGIPSTLETQQQQGQSILGHLLLQNQQQHPTDSFKSSSLQQQQVHLPAGAESLSSLKATLLNQQNQLKHTGNTSKVGPHTNLTSLLQQQQHIQHHLQLLQQAASIQRQQQKQQQGQKDTSRSLQKEQHDESSRVSEYLNTLLTGTATNTNRYNIGHLRGGVGNINIDNNNIATNSQQQIMEGAALLGGFHGNVNVSHDDATKSVKESYYATMEYDLIKPTDDGMFKN